jgi:hypothetical protein
MSDRFSRSFALVKASAAVLKTDPQLLVFPLASALSMLAVVLCFALPMFGLAAFDGLREGPEGSALAYSTGFLFYVVQYAVIFYFNAALVGAAMMRMDGASPSFGDGLRIANSRFGAILGYAVIAATVGILLRAIQERVGFLGRIVVGLLGVGWSVATFLVVPVLVAREVGPVQAVKDSAGLLKQTWGENVIGQAGMGFAFTVIQIALAASGLVLVGLAASVSTALAIAMVALTIGAVLLAVLVANTLAGIYAAALYRYAVDGACIGFDKAVFATAFLPKQ